MTQAEEKQLVRRILDGSQDAFEQLVACYERRIYAMAFRMTRSEQDALDLSQEIFLKIYRSLPGFGFRSSLATWIYHISSSLCIDFLRSRRVRPPAESLTPPPEEDQPDRDIPDERWSPERCAQRRAALEALDKGLGRLSQEHREILLLREMDGLSYDEIASRLSLAPGTVKSRIARARDALRQFLCEEGNFFAKAPSNETESNGKGGHDLV